MPYGLPRGQDSKESACSAGDVGSIPGLGRSPGGGHGNPLQYSSLENPMERGALWATVHGAAKSWTQPSNQAQHVYAMYYNSAGIFLILIFLCPYGNSDNYDVAIIPILHVSKLSLRNTVPIILGSSFYVLNPAWDSG